MWQELCDINFPPKCQNQKNQKHTILGNGEFYIVAKFYANCVKTKNMKEGEHF